MGKTNKRRIKYVISKILICSVLLLAFCVGSLSVIVSARDQNRYEGLTLIPGGFPFGVKFSTEGVVIIGFCDLDGIQKSQNPAYVAGLRPKDVIIKIDGNTIKDASQLTEIIENCNGNELLLTYKRGGVENTVKLTPAYSNNEGKYKTGVWVRDSGAGIGTVTFIDEKSSYFGGLGHGICDGETGELIPINCGAVSDITVNAIKKGIAGTPGEIKGRFGTKRIGTLIRNTDCGVFGEFNEIPENLGKAIPIATRGEIKNGEAQLLCTFDDGVRHKYTIEISEINRDAKGSKCFVIKIKDPDLIEKTGGIVQGMSGSPIIQNGKLIGAVTHVMINDPTVGYGIFIENMLNAAQMPMPLKKAS